MSRIVFFLAGLLFLLWLWKGRPPAAHRQAAILLGVPANARPEAILAAHRHLIASQHPDAGGSTEQAARLNAARDLLLAAYAQHGGRQE